MSLGEGAEVLGAPEALALAVLAVGGVMGVVLLLVLLALALLPGARSGVEGSAGGDRVAGRSCGVPCVHVGALHWCVRRAQLARSAPRY